MPHLLADNFLNAIKSREDATQWVILAVGILATAYLIMRPKLRKKRDPMAGRPVGGFGLSQQRQIERDMNSLMVQMLDTARQMTAQLDTRAARLEVLLQEADQKMARLEEMALMPAQLPAATTKALPEPAPERLQLPAPEETTTNEESADSSYPEPLPDPRYVEIYALADEGMKAVEIAKRLDRPNGEVEFILAMRPRTVSSH